jgi:hypothetical protein
MKTFAALICTFVAAVSGAGLRLDCSDLTPKELKILKVAPAQDPCMGRGTSLVALGTSGVLYLCENGKTAESYDIAIGRGGLGKAKAGDNKTPLGTYSLSQPQVSERFGLFIPVGYPTRAQAANGLTGSDIGIHGPDRIFACAGALNVSVNWTAGCLAVADDRFIIAVSNFVKAHKPVQLHILE